MAYISEERYYGIEESTTKIIWVMQAIGLAYLSQKYFLPERPLENISLGTITTLISSRYHWSSLPVKIIGTLIGSGLEKIVEKVQAVSERVIDNVSIPTRKRSE